LKTLTNVPGLYGKIPVRGDFVTRRLKTAFVDTWDKWLQSALSTSKAQLGDQWLDIYLTSPIWRFVLGPGNCGDTALAGVLMPSVDKVGRYFPLTLAAVIGDLREAPADLFVAAASWFDDMEQLALSALTDDIPLEELDRRLKDRCLSLAPAARPETKGGTVAANGQLIFQTEMEELKDLSEAFAQLSTCLLARSWPAFTLWCTNGSERLRPCLRVYDGLPAAVDYSGFLTGKWPSSIDAHPMEACASLPTDDPVSGIAIKWRSSALSTMGKVRDLNEDAYLEKPESGIWAVADGMGGHLAGDEAAKSIVDGLGAIAPVDSIDELSAEVTACLKDTNNKLIRQAGENNPDQIMGSTVVVMLAVGSHCASLWAGDSRLYRWRNGLLSQLTRDHTMAAEIGFQDPPSPEASAADAQHNIVTRALGAEPELELDTLFFEARGDDIYLLCSDGLTKEASPQEITAIISGPDCAESSQALIDLAMQRGARDNVTVVVVVAEADTRMVP
jgi:type VI secretion system protein ImpM